MKPRQLFLSLDQLVNVLLNGYADETLSCRAWRTQHWSYRWIDKLIFWQPDHCKHGYESEQKRMQLPPAMRP